jgi:hypothetical protein
MADAKLRRSIIRLAHDEPTMRAHLVPFLRRLAAEEEEGGKKPGGGKRPGGKFLEFMKEMGDTKVRNPDTGNDVKLKSLKGDKGKKLQNAEFEKWLKKQDDKDDKGKGKGKGGDKDDKGSRPMPKKVIDREKTQDKMLKGLTKHWQGEGAGDFLDTLHVVSDDAKKKFKKWRKDNPKKPPEDIIDEVDMDEDDAEWIYSSFNENALDEHAYEAFWHVESAIEDIADKVPANAKPAEIKKQVMKKIDDPFFKKMFQKMSPDEVHGVLAGIADSAGIEGWET